MSDKDIEQNKEKTFYFVSGLPRSGSTLLENILAQNPRFHATPTSGVSSVIMTIRNMWSQNPLFKAAPNDDALVRVMRGVFDSYYADIDRPVVFDKSRSWPAQIEILEKAFGHKVKILATVRDIRDVVSSFEKLWRENSPYQQVDHERTRGANFQTLRGRVQTWLDNKAVVGSSYNALADAIKRGFADRILFVDFEDLTNKPKETLNQIYDFLGEEYFEHDFKNVEQVTHEDDRHHGILNLHKIRREVKPVPSRWPDILGKEYENLGKMNFWKKK